MFVGAGYAGEGERCGAAATGELPEEPAEEQAEHRGQPEPSAPRERRPHPATPTRSGEQDQRPRGNSL